MHVFFVDNKVLLNYLNSPCIHVARLKWCHAYLSYDHSERLSADSSVSFLSCDYSERLSADSSVSSEFCVQLRLFLNLRFSTSALWGVQGGASDPLAQILTF